MCPLKYRTPAYMTMSPELTVARHTLCMVAWGILPDPDNLLGEYPENVRRKQMRARIRQYVEHRGWTLKLIGWDLNSVNTTAAPKSVWEIENQVSLLPYRTQGTLPEVCHAVLRHENGENAPT